MRLPRSSGLSPLTVLFCRHDVRPTRPAPRYRSRIGEPNAGTHLNAELISDDQRIGGRSPNHHDGHNPIRAGPLLAGHAEDSAGSEEAHRNATRLALRFLSGP